MSQLGRISGPLLKSNLIRDGVDLAFETDLLYLNVTNARIGLNTASPNFDLDVNGTTRTTNLIVDTQLDVGVLTFVDNNISSSTNEISFLSPTGNEATVYQARLLVDDFQITGNTISTEVSNVPIEIRPSGTGTVELQASTNIDGDLFVSGKIDVDGNVTIGGDVIIGDEKTDTIEVNAKIASNLVPNEDQVFDIGTPTKRWRNVFISNLEVSQTLDIGNFSFEGNTISTSSTSIIFDTPEGESVIFNSKIVVDDIQIAGNVISTEVSNSPLELRPSGTGTIELQSDTNVTGDLDVSNDLTVGNDALVGGNLTIGTDGDDILTINSKLTGDLIPSIDNFYNIGSTTHRWKDVYADNFYITTELDVGDINFTSNVISTTENSITFTTPNSEATVFNSRIVVDDIQIQGNVISTEVSNSNLDLRPSGTGKVKLKADTEIDGDLDVTGNINASGSITIGGDIIIGDESTDTITINASIQSDLIPAEDVTFAIGNPDFRWKDIHVETVNASFVNVSDLQIGDLQFSGNTVSTDAGTDITLNAGGAVNLGNFRINENNITNIVSGAISVFEQIGDGYFKIATTNGFVPPVGNVANRPTAYAVIGMTRYNTDSSALEIWNGSAWTSPAGPLSGITEVQAEDIAASFALILG